jgi:hypothetical protein
VLRKIVLALVPLLAAPSLARAEGPARVATSSAAAAPTFDAQAALDGLERRLATIEAQFRQTASKVEVLRGNAFGGVIARTTAVILHKNELGAAYQLDRAVYSLDGKVVLSREDAAAAKGLPPTVALYDGPMNAGQHLLRASLVYSGAGYGPFTYLKGYRFKIESSHAFDVAEGRRTTVRMVSHERSDFAAAPADRIGVRYDVEVTDPRPAPRAKP